MLEFSLMISMISLSLSAFCTHPLVLCLLLISSAFFVSIFSGMILTNWFMYAILLIFLGGMMVVFIYITTLSGNEKFFLTPQKMNFILPLIIFYSFLFFSVILQKNSTFFMSHLYFNISFPLLFFLMTFLFCTLFTVIKMAESFKGALTKSL